MLAMAQPVEGVMIGLVWCVAFYKSLRWAGPDLKFVRTLMVRTYFCSAHISRVVLVCF